MASTVTEISNLINIEYPVAGQDNDSQGFRTNFSLIQSALERTNNEISDIQLNSVSLSETNNFGGNIIQDAAIEDSSLILKTYTTAELAGLTSVTDGTVVFVSTLNRPAWHAGGTWYAITGTAITLS